MSPKNGLYLTSADYESWQDYFGALVKDDYVKPRPGVCATDPDLKSKNITFVVTEKCNLNCTYCYETHKSNKKMSKQVAKDAIDFLFDEGKVNGYFDHVTSPGVILDFIGGEPLLEIELIDYIVEYFKFKAFEVNSPWAFNYMIAFTTNGILFKTKAVQDFLKRNKGRVSIGLTIDGNKELHDACRVFPNGSGSYDIVEEAAKEWVKIDGHPQTKITLSPFNVSYLNNALRNVWNLGINGAHTNCVFEEGWTKEHAKIFYKELIKLADYLLEEQRYSKFYTSLFDESIGTPLVDTKNWCGGNGRMLAIAPDGRCFPCIRFMKYSLSERKEQPIGDIWNGLNKKEDNKWLNQLKQINMVTQCQWADNKKCLTCQIAQGCSLCTGYNYDKFGDPNHKATFICDMHHARVLANVYYWNELYKNLGIDRAFVNNVPKDWRESNGLCSNM
ncbi:radical SAM peptide maturase, CXXX-repeat target family [Candidatus Desulfosporosinus nitrosoreducens]|uniref:radical SAM peptide maturase, CXXX-repeat target family n=1 Tax=Candidatus Desulfosporosinus nitrosoreducens TaxID=3401928 RepID=UPI00280B5A7A|nr:radical SAM peptide maturase, CXXX-repeat target family [Desulfosporosinus sp. PR]